MGFELNYFTRKFLWDHVEILKGDDDVREAKQKAERRFIQRFSEGKDDGFQINTLLCLWKKDLIRLVAEIQNRQSEYASKPNERFDTVSAYTFYARDIRKGKNAKVYGPSRFRYAVRREVGSELLKMHHFDRMID